MTVKCYTTFFESSCFYKCSKNLKRGSSFSKNHVTRPQLNSWYLYTFRKQLLGTYKVWQRNNWLNLMSQYRPCIPEKCLAAIKLFHKIEARLWKCYYVTIKKLHFTFFTKVMSKIRITMVNVLIYYITS